MNNVFFAEADIVVVGSDMLQSLRDAAATAPLKRARFCLHRNNDAPIHEMVIAFTRDSYVRPHRHRGKSESFHVMQGSLQVILFDDSGRITRRIRLGSPESGLPSLYRLSCDMWHTVLLESDSVIIHETTNGPFVPDATEFADWAPDGEHLNDAIAFCDRLRMDLPSEESRSAAIGRGDDSATDRSSRTATGSLIRTDSPTLTAIVCNYNHGRLVSRAIEAIMTQSRPPDEIIIVDDFSSDDSVSVIRSWVAKCPSIVFLQNDRNLGFQVSFQRAVAVASSDFVYSGAADDRVLPGFFEGAMQLAQRHPNTGIICGEFVSVDPSGKRLSINRLKTVLRDEFLEPAQYRREVLEAEAATHSTSCATIFRRKPLWEVGCFRVELGSWGDTFALQTLGLKHGFCYWPHPAMEWTVMPGGMSQTTRSNPQAALKIVDRAVEYMRSDEFCDLFPADYIEKWERGFRLAIVDEQLTSAIEGHIALQSRITTISKTAKLPLRSLLVILGLGIRALYFVTIRVLRCVVAHQLQRPSKRS